MFGNLGSYVRAFRIGYKAGQAIGATPTGNGVTVQDGVNAVVDDVYNGRFKRYLNRWRWSEISHAWR